MRRVDTSDWDFVGWHYKAIHTLAPPWHNRIWVRSKGLENIPERESFLYAANHWSWWDPIILQTSIGRPVNWLAKKEMMNNAFNKWFFFDKGGCIPVDRDRRNPEAFKAAAQALRDGRIIGIFPQATRRAPDDWGNPKPGVARLAFETGAPVVPTALLTDEFWPPGRKTPKLSKRVWLNVGAPMHLKGDPRDADATREATDQVMASIRALVDEARDARARNDPSWGPP